MEPSLHLQNFNNKVKSMNQMRARDLTMSADDVRNLHSDIFALLAQIARLEELAARTPEQRLDLTVDGGGFNG